MKMALQMNAEPRITITLESDDYRAAAFDGQTLMFGLTLAQTLTLSKLFQETIIDALKE